MQPLAEEVVLLTGAAGGLGRAMAAALLRAGARVVAVDRPGAALEALAGGAELCRVAADLAAPASAEAAMRAAERRFGRVDAVVHNAGINMATHLASPHAVRPRFWEVELDAWDLFRSVNADAVFRLSPLAVGGMLRRNHGRFVGVTTSLASMLRGGLVPYGPSKACAESLLAVMAEDLAGTGVTANVLVPGAAADTPMAVFPEGSQVDRAALLPPEAMGPPLSWLLSREAAAVTGQRFRAIDWDLSLPGAEAAAHAAAPIGWRAIANDLGGSGITTPGRNMR